MNRPDPVAVQSLSDWMIETALRASDYTPMFDEFCKRLIDLGIPIARVNLAMTTLHPLMEAFNMLWHRDSGSSEIFAALHGDHEGAGWQQSPLKAMVDSGKQEIRHNLRDHTSQSQYPILQELAEEGMTDYLAFLSPFSDMENVIIRQDGLLTSWTTDHPDGFSEGHIETLRRLIPRFALIAKMANRERLRENLAFAYLGENAGKRVLNGQIKLGDGQTIRAVIWFSDLRGSTPLAEQLPREVFLELLNDYFHALAGAVMENGGEVLRFIGDAALAIFPIGEEGYSEKEARERAVQAVRDAQTRAERKNNERTKSDKTPFRYGIGLHVGDIMYGNIGVPSRLEFSVIGAAANEAARLEGLTKELGEPVLVSGLLADGLDLAWRPLGDHTLRGSNKSMSIFAPPSNE